jgi:hypothetical protein
MHPAYFETRFRTQEFVDYWPREFVILTACATTGESWTPHRNESADEKLACELRARGAKIVRISGYSPRTGHAEPGWAAEIPFDEACDIGLRFRQDALYHVRGDILSVSFCDHQRSLVPVGPFRERVDLENAPSA